VFFSCSITVPAGGDNLNPVRATLAVAPGVVRHVWVRWRWGLSAEGGARILYQEFQYWPLTIAAWFPNSPDALDFDDSIPLLAAPWELAVEAYNSDPTYDEELWIAVSVLPEQPMTLGDVSLDSIEVVLLGEYY